MNSLAPIVLFTYKRLFHTQKTLDYLKRNHFAKQSHLIIYSDGPKNFSDLPEIKKVRVFVSNLKGFAKVELRIQKTNIGLAKSIIKGVSEVTAQYQKAIILEDDLITSPYFLTYMNKCLEMYKDNKQVGMIGGWSPNTRKLLHFEHDVFLTQRSCSWGWATWHKYWLKVDWQVKDYQKFLLNSKKTNSFEARGNGMLGMLQRTMDGQLDTWDIIWDYFLFNHNLYCLRPKRSLVKNIGNDGSGTNCSSYDKFKTKLDDSFNPLVTKVSYQQSIDNAFKQIYNSTYKDRFMYFLYHYKIIK